MLKLTTDKHEISRGLSAIAELLVPCGSRRSKGVPYGMPYGSGIFLRLLVGKLGTPKLSQSFDFQMAIYPYRNLLQI